MIRNVSLALIGAAACLPFAVVSAHHSATAYDSTATASVTGTITNLAWRNPHVLLQLDVVGKDGKTINWTLETTAPASLAEAGWSRDLLKPGTKVTAEIRPPRGGAPAGILRWVTLADGTVLPIDKDSPRSGGASAATSQAAEPAPVSLPELAAESRTKWLQRRKDADARNKLSLPASLPLVGPDGVPGAFDPENVEKMAALKPPFDLTGVWQFRREEEHYEALKVPVWDFMPLPKLTPKAQAIYDETMAARAAGTNVADPTALCYPPGMPRLMTRIGNFMLVQRPTAIHLVHRFNNSMRTIYLDGRQHVPAAIRQDSYNGDSIGIWDNDSLFIETIGFGQPNQFVQAGLPIGAAARVTERWRVINGGNTIEIEFVITDPEHWEGEWIDTKFFDRIHQADIREANCIAAEDAKIPGSTESAGSGPGTAGGNSGTAAAPATQRSWAGNLPGLLLGALLGAAGAWFAVRRRLANKAQI